MRGVWANTGHQVRPHAFQDLTARYDEGIQLLGRCSIHDPLPNLMTRELLHLV